MGKREHSIRKDLSILFVSTTHLHIVSFDIPYPADYGGVIDVFNKIIALKQIGFHIHLHCFFSERLPNENLLNYCDSVNYYSRKTGLKGISFRIPYIVSSRDNKQLEENLLKDTYPILLEGLHCTSVLKNKAFADRKIFLRAHNVEHRYYEKLASQETNFFKKCYFKIESKLLKKYEFNIVKRIVIFAISASDAAIFSHKMNAKDVQILPAFTKWKTPENLSPIGTNCLYHGNLSINENENAVLWLIQEVFKETNYHFTIAGYNPSKKLIQAVAHNNNINLVANPSDSELESLIRAAHINVLPSFNNTGVKLKLLNALFNGRFCLVNNAAIEGSFLSQTCEIANSADEFKNSIATLTNKAFDIDLQSKRNLILNQYYSNDTNAEKLSSWIR